jgi:formylglycine-generating enzyme
MVLTNQSTLDIFGDGYNDEKSVHEVCIDGFYIGNHEVTQGQWEEVMGNNPSEYKNGRDYPVESVNWNDVQEFIKILNKKTGRSYRLPTEAEWEYAARERGKRVRFGTGKNTIGSEEANFDASSFYKEPFSRVGKNRWQTTPVKTFAPNGLGIYDMSGNVCEWCQDIYSSDAYSKHQRNNPIYTGSGSGRVNRGGGWVSFPGRLRASGRYNSSPDVRRSSLGFRLARTVD